ncbi:MAG: hypothetical protein QMD11_11005, partial [Smithella sp.]|nr:hypothetical protein [Smithella sp.]
TGVRVERLQEITEEGAINEGLLPCGSFALGHELDKFAVERFAVLWDGIYSGRGYGWEQNPWVWVIEFEKVGKEKAP